MTGVVIVWLIIEYVSSFLLNSDSSIILGWRITYAVAVFMIFTVFRFLAIFSKTHLANIFYYAYLLLSCSLAIFILITDSVLKSAILSNYGNSFVVGDFYFIFILLGAGPLTIGAILVLVKYIKAKDQNFKKQLLYIFLGMLFPIFLGLTVNVVFPLIGLHTPKLAHISSVIFVSFIVYVIYKYQAMGVSIQRIKIKTRLILSFIIIALFVSTIGSFIYIQNISNILKDQTTKNLESIAITRAGIIDKYIKIEKLNISNISDLPQVIDFFKSNNQNIQELKDALLFYSKQKEIIRISLFDRKGDILFSNDSGDVEFDIHKALDSININEEYYKDIFYSEKYKRFAINFAFPVNDGGNVLGGLLVKVDMSFVSDILTTSTGLGSTEDLYLINEKYYPITPLLKIDDTGFSSSINSKGISNCFNKVISGQDNEENISIYNDYIGELVVGTGIYMNDYGWCLMAELDYDQSLGQVQFQLIILTIIMIICITAGVGLFGYLVSTSIYKPLEKLKDGIKQVENGDFNVNIYSESKDEIGDLSRAFDKMISAVLESRSEVDEKVEEQTTTLLSTQQELESQQKAILNILEDVEEEKDRAEQERERMTAILQGIGDMVFVVDQNGRIVLFNKIAEDVTGISEKEAIGNDYKNVFKFINERTNKPVKDFIKEAIETKKITHIEENALLVNKAGQKIPVADSAAPIKREDAIIGIVIVLRDVTKEREINKMKTEFVSVASHQLRTPLSAIKWFIEMLINEDAGKINKQQKEFLDQAYLSNERMIKLVNDLLNVSRIEQGRLSVEPKPTNLNKLAEEVIAEINHQFVAKNIKFKFIKDNKLPKIKIDPNIIREVFKNLLNNAVSYTPGKGNITLKIEKKANDVLVSIKDTGIGIPKDQQNRLFEKFFRADNALTTETSGSGLGLYVVKSAIESSAGEIWFESKEGKGTSFYFKLPIKGSPKIKGEKGLAI